MTRARADALVVARGLARSRTQAQALILAGQVTFRAEGMGGPQRVDKPGALLREDAELFVERGPRFVSRGGDKLEGALEELEPKGLAVAGRACLDVGASTGGFTDCLLQRGAVRVVAVDVGHGQLAAKLRADPRVDARERTDARDLSPADLPPIDLVVVDASFIGIGKLIGAIERLLPEGGDLVALVKPQFEAGRREASRGRGVIRDEPTRLAAIASARAAIEEAGFTIEAEVDSRVHGPKGNVERFLWGKRRKR